ncbi:MAG: alanine:cation symporter family protein [Lachnospiraceae bacterium]|nr:alanine:cation symporter family protein [Lachnospiraceae bacterium]
MSESFTNFISFVYGLFWGDLFSIPLPNGGTVGFSFMVLLLIPIGIYFTIRTGFLPIRMFPEMLRIALEKEKDKKDSNSVSGMQTLIVSTATRVGTGNLVGVVAAVSAGGAGAVFWMWISALIGSSTAFIEATLAQLHKEKDTIYGGFRGGPAHYIRDFMKEKTGRKTSMIAILFALSGLLCWCAVSQIVSNSVSEAFYNAFHIPPMVSTVILVAIAAVIVLRKHATVKVLDVLVPVMAAFYFVMTVVVIGMNVELLPSVFKRIIDEAFGIRQVTAGGFGAVLMNGVKRGLFSNEAGSGSAPCAAAAADVSHPAKSGLFQALGVLIDTIVICTCTAMLMLLAPEELLSGLSGMALLQTAMSHHFGQAGVIFIAIALWLFSFSTFLGILYYARPNVAFVFGDDMKWQTAYKIIALVMLFIGGLAKYTLVWDLGDIGVGLMTIFNIIIILPMGGEALNCLKEYLEMKK